MKKKVSLLILAIFLSFIFITLANSNLSKFSNNILINSTSTLSTSETAWTANGTEISVMANNQEEVDICSDGAGGAIITWWDYRFGNSDIFAQRVYADGSVAWTTGGVAICTQVSPQINPQICGDGAGGAIIVWTDARVASADIYAQKISASGVVQWTNDGVAVCTATGTQSIPQLCNDGAGGAIICWQDQRSGTYVYAQRVLSATGASDWTADGIQISSISGVFPAICSDGAGGALIAFVTGDIYAQRLNSTGHLQWNSTGVSVCLAADMQQNPQLINDGAGNAIITWEDLRSNPSWHIYASKVTATGIVQWTADGVPICTIGSNNNAPQICSDGGDGAIITWVKDGDISTQRISSIGTLYWTPNGKDICTASGTQNEPQICSVGAGGAIITWKDNRAGSNEDIYAQKINSSGGGQFTANGIVICNATGIQELPQICADGTGGAIIAWDDERMGASNDDIYAQKISGNPQFDWATLISLAALGSYEGLIEEITNFFEATLSILLSPIVMGGIIIGEALIIVILSSIVSKSRSSGISKKAKKP